MRVITHLRSRVFRVLGPQVSGSLGFRISMVQGGPQVKGFRVLSG